jgi:hypothetical protein
MDSQTVEALTEAARLRDIAMAIIVTHVLLVMTAGLPAGLPDP